MDFLKEFKLELTFISLVILFFIWLGYNIHQNTKYTLSKLDTLTHEQLLMFTKQCVSYNQCNLPRE